MDHGRSSLARHHFSVDPCRFPQTCQNATYHIRKNYESFEILFEDRTPVRLGIYVVEGE
jgi:hypothetical protein